MTESCPIASLRLLSGRRYSTGSRKAQDRHPKYTEEFATVKPWLLTGNQLIPTHLHLLRNYGITNVVNLVTDVMNYYPEDISYLHIKMVDLPGFDFTEYLMPIFHFIERARHQCGVVYIHCIDGRSRAPAVSAAYLMWKDRVSVEEALRTIKNQMPDINPNHGFLSQLEEFYTTLQSI